MTEATETADLLYGVPAIAAFLEMREKQCRHRVEQGAIPTFKMGSTICSRRSTLRAWLAQAEAAGRRPLPEAEPPRPSSTVPARHVRRPR